MSRLAKLALYSRYKSISVTNYSKLAQNNSMDYFIFPFVKVHCSLLASARFLYSLSAYAIRWRVWIHVTCSGVIDAPIWVWDWIKNYKIGVLFLKVLPTVWYDTVLYHLDQVLVLGRHVVCDCGHKYQNRFQNVSVISIQPHECLVQSQPEQLVDNSSLMDTQIIYGK